VGGGGFPDLTSFVPCTASDLPVLGTLVRQSWILEQLTACVNHPDGATALSHRSGQEVQAQWPCRGMETEEMGTNKTYGDEQANWDHTRQKEVLGEEVEEDKWETEHQLPNPTSTCLEGSALAALVDATLIPEVSGFLDNVGALPLFLGACMRSTDGQRVQGFLAIVANMASCHMLCPTVIGSEFLPAMLGRLLVTWTTAPTLLAIYTVVTSMFRKMELSEAGLPLGEDGTMLLQRVAQDFVFGPADFLYDRHVFVLAGTTNSELARQVLLVLVLVLPHYMIRDSTARETLSAALSLWEHLPATGLPEEMDSFLFDMDEAALARAVRALIEGMARYD